MMHRRPSKKYGPTLVTEGNRLDRRGRRCSPIRTAAELDLEARVRRAFVLHAVAPDGTVVSRAVQDIREGRQRPANAIGRRAIEMRAAGSSYESFRKIVREIEEWGEELFNGRPAA